jgi:predicted PurR-regulated permease PerM
MSNAYYTTLAERFVPATLLLALLTLGLLTLSPFLPAILWGVILAVAFRPRFHWLVGRLGGRRKLAAWATGLVLALLFVVPALGLARALVAFLPDALSWLERTASSPSGPPPQPLREIPAIGPHVAALWHSLWSDTRGLLTHFGDELKTTLLWTVHELQGLGVFVFEFAIGVILAVLLLYREERVTDLSARFLDRVGGRSAQRLAALSVATTRQTVRGVLGAALAQTLVATFSYVVAGVPGWPIWAGLTFLLALVQIGPVLIWVPMSLWLWAGGQPSMALFVFLWGAIVVHLTDNLVRPLLVSQGSNLPAALAFLGAVGGLLEWGVVGVFLGPVVVAVGYELLMTWIEPETLPDETTA